MLPPYYALCRARSHAPAIRQRNQMPHAHHAGLFGAIDSAIAAIIDEELSWGFGLECARRLAEIKYWEKLVA